MPLLPDPGQASQVLRALLAAALNEAAPKKGEPRAAVAPPHLLSCPLVSPLLLALGHKVSLLH